jgi:signal transduction histidine kinase
MLTLRFRTITFLVFLAMLLGFIVAFSISAYYTTTRILEQEAYRALEQSKSGIEHEFNVQLRLIDQDLFTLAQHPGVEYDLSLGDRQSFERRVFGRSGDRIPKYHFALLRSYTDTTCWLVKNALMPMGNTACQSVYDQFNSMKRTEWSLMKVADEWFLVKDFLITNEEQRVVARLLGGVRLSQNDLFLSQLLRRSQSDVAKAVWLADGEAIAHYDYPRGETSDSQVELLLDQQGFGVPLEMRLFSQPGSTQSLMDQLKKLLIIGALVGLFVSAIVAALLSTALDRQLQKLLNYIKQLVEVQETRVWMPAGIREFNRIGQQMGEVVSELANRRQQLKLTNDRLRKTLREKRSILHQLINSQEQERNHLAQELHDELGQLLTAVRVETTLLEHQVSMNSPALKNTHKIKELVAAMYATVYDRIMALRPAELDHLGLSQSIAQIPTLDSLRQSGVDVELKLAKVTCPSGSDIHLYRITQEALTNTLKHALATKVSISLKQDEANLILCIQDDGQGIKPDPVVDVRAPKGFGLLGIEERCDYIGAFLTIESDPGVTLTVTLPMSPFTPVI